MPVERYRNPRKAQWPQADFIIGNPPFIGASTLRRALGDGYVDALRATWAEVPESADFVMHWWHIAAQFKRKPTQAVHTVLEALAALGLAHQADTGWHA